MEELTLGQKCSLIEILKDDENLQKHFELNGEDVWDIVSGLTLKQYKYILYLLFNKKYFKLNKMLTSINIKPKKYE
jgi:hypothetical protein